MIAVLCAIRQEVSPLVAGMDVSKKFYKDDVLFYQGVVNGQFLTIVQGGMGRENAMKAARSLLESVNIDLLISAGVAGGIRRGLNVGDLIVAESVGYSKQTDFTHEELRLDKDFACKKEIVEIARQLCAGLQSELHFGNLLTVERVIGSAEIKRKIGEQSAFMAVEMESAAIAEVACEKKINFAAIRSISDDIEDDLHLDYDNMMSDEGKVKVTGIALEVLKNPQKLAILSRINRQTKTAAKSLAYFMSQLIPLIDTNFTN